MCDVAERNRVVFEVLALPGGPLMRRLSIAHMGAKRKGRKLTRLFQGVTLRVGIENRRKAKSVPTFPTVPGGLTERGRKSTPPFAEPRVRWNKELWGGVE